MKLPQFQYIRPKSIEEASELLAHYGSEACALAGGTDLLVKMKQRRLVPGYVVNLKSIPGLDYIRYDESEGLRLGPLATIQSIKNSVVVKRNYRVLNQAAGVESSVQIRNRATIAGNIANSSPVADAPLALIVHGASVVIASAEGEREVLLENFFVGPGASVLEPGELIREIRVPPPVKGSGGAYMKFAVRRNDIAIVSAGVLLTLANGICMDARIGLGAVAPTAVRAKSAEEALKGQAITEETIQEAVEEVKKQAKPINDIRGYADYRSWALSAVVERIIHDAAKDAKLGGA
jgi:CO/xanthine dehydrogenase FAD-binding subunit